MIARYNRFQHALCVLALVAAALLPGPALAQDTAPHPAQAAAITCNVQSTPNYTEYYGDVRIDGVAAPIDAVVEALNDQGIQAGCFVVTIPGLYGYMRVYGADADTGTPGMTSGETVTFRVNGAPATAAPVPAQWSGDKGQHGVDLSSQALPAAVEDLAAALDDNNDLVLTWTDVGGDFDHYEVWRGQGPYFAPEVPKGTLIAANIARPGQVGGSVSFTDTDCHVPDTAVNDYYLILAVTAGGVKSLVSNRTGALDFELTQGS